MNLFLIANTSPSFDTTFSVIWLLFAIIVTLAFSFFSRKKKEQRSNKTYPHENQDSTLIHLRGMIN